LTTLPEAAVLLAQRGYRVFPVAEDKAPLTPRGHLDGTSDVEAVRRWAWDGGIGLVIPDRTFVVDVDPRNGGCETLAAVVEAHGTLPQTRTVRTRSGGWHYYFGLTPLPRSCGHKFVLSSCEECANRKYPDLRGKLGPGVDVKKPGRGYVLVPPTEGYRYLRGGRPALAPEWLLDELSVSRRVSDGAASAPKFFVGLVAGTPYGLAALRQKCEQMRECGEGGRRSTLNTCAFVLATLAAGGELDEEKALECLLEAAMDAGLSESQALAAMKSGWAAGLQNPRSAE
jgi:hypothetical protein